MRAAQVWKTGSVRVRGTSHYKSGMPCQDYCVAHTTSDITILALSDGAGSCEHSHIGSKAACVGFIKGVREVLKPHTEKVEDLDSFIGESNRESWLPALDYAAQSIILAAEKIGTNPEKSMACTFLGAIIGKSCAIVLQIGDGAWVAETGATGFNVVTWPEHGEYANQTYFLTEAGYSDHLQFEKIPNNGNLRTLIGFSDGIERLCLNFSQKIAIDGFFQPLASAHEHQSKKDFKYGLKRFLASEKITNLSDDDTSVIIASRANDLL